MTIFLKTATMFELYILKYLLIFLVSNDNVLQIFLFCCCCCFLTIRNLLQSHVDGEQFLKDLKRNITTETAFDAVLRVRTSAGKYYLFYFCQVEG